MSESDYVRLSSLIEEIIDEAIKAAMIHDGWHLAPNGWYSQSAQVSSLATYDTPPPGVPVPPDTAGGRSDPATYQIIVDSTAVYQQWRDAVEAAFEDFHGLPEPGDLKPAVQQLLHCMGRMADHGSTTSEEGSVQHNEHLFNLTKNMEDRLSHWNGSAALAFNDTFVSKFPDAAQAQLAAVSALYSAAGAEQETWKRCRSDIGEIAARTRDAMKSAQATGEADGWETALTVIGAVASIGATLASGGSALVVAAGVSGTVVPLLGPLKASMEQPSEEVRFPGGSPDAVLSDLLKALETTRSRLRTQEQDVENHLQGVLDVFASSPLTFSVRKPLGFLRESDPHQLVAPGDQLSVVRESLTKVSQWMADYAGDLHHVSAVLEDSSSTSGWYRPAGLGISSVGPYYSFSALISQISEALALTRTELSDLGDKLLVFADDIEGTDANVRLDLNKVHQDLGDEWREDRHHYAPPPPPAQVQPHGGKPPIW
ncbi:MAG: hypothetical protein JWO76_1298 [Nocardioides sp.]|nr:hypothetical protein [Nocardioides sp.]